MQPFVEMEMGPEILNDMAVALHSLLPRRVTDPTRKGLITVRNTDGAAQTREAMRSEGRSIRKANPYSDVRFAEMCNMSARKVSI